jgi:Predicted amidophosphoribosyltransferases
MKIKSLWNSFVSVFYPQTCVVCDRALIEGEEFFCLHCLLNIPFAGYRNFVDNSAAERLKEKFLFQKASSLLYYTKGGAAQKIIAEIKYRRNIKLGKWMGCLMAREMQANDFWEDIDCIVPVPLHKKRRRQRGYNQAEVIAQGITEIVNIPVDTHTVYRKIYNPSQTKKGSFERWQNTRDIFGLSEDSCFENKHVLIVDDVLTTGSTIEACARTIAKSRNTRVSIVTLAVTQ